MLSSFRCYPSQGIYAPHADSVLSIRVPLRRADRLFDIIRILRTAPQPVTAAVIAEELEVTVRTVYWDVATLQARRIPIEGAVEPLGRYGIHPDLHSLGALYSTECEVLVLDRLGERGNARGKLPERLIPC